MTIDVTPDGLALESPRPRTDELVSELTSLAPLLFRVAMSIVRNRSLAEDVVQETLVKAWTNLDKFRGDAPFRVWVIRIANNTAISMLRKQRDQPTDPVMMSEVLAGGAGPDRNAEGRAMVDQLWRALDRLDPLSRAIVVLREIEAMSYEDIAEALDVALPTVKTRLFRARRELALRLEEWR
jgi:RNA polymerase sigma-70 factor (ECF subfamily)